LFTNINKYVRAMLRVIVAQKYVFPLSIKR